MRIFLDSTGCRLNQSEIETLARQFRAAGHEIVNEVADAELCVINTCAVTREAERTSRSMIRRAHRENAKLQIVATGCYAHLSREVVGALPGVARVVDNDAKDRLVPLVLGDEVPLATFDHEPLVREAVPGILGRTRAFVKVQDGCNNRCTFCVTTIARGKGRSRPLADVVAEIRALVAQGYQEVVLTGVHLGSYGHDRGERQGLQTLVRSILDDTAIARLRLSSLEPWDLSPDFFELWQNQRLCRHLHLPLQSGCDETLRRMARRTNQEAFRELVFSARAAIPDLAISTDVIVGFPGETDKEFETSLAFVREMNFAKIHVFRYSPRPQTAAARMVEQIDAETKKRRSARMLALSEEGMSRFIQHHVTRRVDVLWEQVNGTTESGFVNVGLTDNYIRVVMESPEVLTNRITTVTLNGLAGRSIGGVALASAVPAVHQGGV